MALSVAGARGWSRSRQRYPVPSCLECGSNCDVKVNKTKNCILRKFLQSDRNGSTNVGCATFAHWRIFYGPFSPASKRYDRLLRPCHAALPDLGNPVGGKQAQVR